jgi:RES domain-containing protein
VIEIEIPEAVSMKTLQVSEQPAGWDDPRPSDSLKSIGTNRTRSNATALLSVPSSIVSRERNYLLNPNHPEFT